MNSSIRSLDYRNRNYLNLNKPITAVSPHRRALFYPSLYPMTTAPFKSVKFSRNTKDIITKDKELQNIWSKTPILALQRHNNLGDWLTHIKF